MVKNSVTSITISPYKRRYRRDVRDLMFRSYRTHSHLDWFDSDQWLDAETTPVRLAWTGGRLVGLLATSEPLDRTCWVRLAAVDDAIQSQPVLAALWDELRDELRARSVHTVALLVLRDWIAEDIGELGFHLTDEIVTLRRDPQPLPEPRPYPVAIRVNAPSDLETIARVDQTAFEPPWQLSLSEIRQAERMSTICTVALVNDVIVGYQLSTLYFDGGHLARLAVLPDAQGRGVGYALVDDLLRRFARRSVFTVTVNTQLSNTRSQRLYARFGFARSGYDLPVWMAQI